MLRLFIAFELLMYFGFAGVALHATTAENLTVEEVVKLTRAKFSEDIIITKIKKNGKPFDLSTDELLDLKKDGVGENVIKYLLDPSLPYTAPPPKADPHASSSEPTKQYPLDPLASRVPQESGFYLFPANTLSKVDLKFLLGTEEAKTLVKKAKTTAYLIGSTSGRHLDTPNPVFYVRLPDGKEIEELVLVSLAEKNGRREISFAPKQELKAEDMRQRELLEVGPKLFRVTPTKLNPGEYLFLFIGSAEPPKGIFGKGYDFTITTPAAPPKSR